MQKIPSIQAEFLDHEREARLMEKTQSMRQQIQEEALNLPRAPSYLNSSNPHLLPYIANNKKSDWYEHKYGYSKRQNKVHYKDVDTNEERLYMPKGEFYTYESTD